MQMVSREQFLPTVRLHITGPLEVMLGEAVTEAAITFCRESALLTLDRLLPSTSAGSLVEVCNISGMTSCNVLHLTGADGVPLDSGRDQRTYRQGLFATPQDSIQTQLADRALASPAALARDSYQPCAAA